MHWRAAGCPLALRNARIDVDLAVRAAHRSVDLRAGTQNCDGPVTREARLALVGVDHAVAGDGIKDIATDAQTLAGLGRAGASRKALVGVGDAVRAGHGIEVETAPTGWWSFAGTNVIAMLLQVRGDGMDIDLDGLALVADLDQPLLC